MSALLPILVTWLQQYGYIVLWFSTFLAAAGLPLPTALILLAAGAFAAQGDYNIVLLVMITISASVGGDSVGYLIGRYAGNRVLGWLAQQKQVPFISSQTLARSRVYFERKGAWAIFLSRFLFSALGGVLNLIAGAERYSYRRFLLWDFCGEVLGALIPLVLGYSFGESWESIGNLLGASSGFVLALLVALFLLIRLVKILRQSKPAQQANHPMSSVPTPVETTQGSLDRP